MNKYENNTVILARVSSKAQEDEGYSLDSQLKLLQGYCQQRGLVVIKTFNIAETASKEQSRRVFHELLDYLQKQKVYHLAVEKTDRLTRNFNDAVAIDAWLDKNPDRRLHAVKESLLLHKEAKSDVKFMWNIHLSVAKKYTDNLREEAMKGWAEKLAQGWLPGVPPPGYKTVVRDGKKIHVLNQETCHFIKQVFELYVEPGQTIKTVVDHLKGFGITTRNGRPYGKSQVHKMLSNPFYIGINRHNGKDYPGAQEHLISKELFHKVQDKLHQKSSGGRRRTHNPVFKSMIRCSNCNGVVTWQLQKGRYYGACQRKADGCKDNRHIREDRLEDTIREMMEDLVSPTSEVIDWAVEAMKSHYQKEILKNERLAMTFRQQVDRLKRMQSNLYDDKLAGEISKDIYEQKSTEINSQLQHYKQKLSGLDQMSGVRLKHKLVLLELSQKASSIYMKRSPDHKRVIITKLFENITYKGGVVSVKYTRFARAIAENVLETRKILGV